MGGFTSAFQISFSIIITINSFVKNQYTKKIDQQNKIIALEQQNTQIALDAKRKFLAKMSHEIRSPLHLMLGLINIAYKKKNVNDSELDKLKISSDRLLKVVNEVFELNQEESDSEINLEKFSDLSDEILPSNFNEFSDLKILFVDDIEDNNDLIKMIFKKYPFSIDFAVNGKEAVEKISKNNYNIVFMDLKMPVMDGFTATKIIREKEKKELITPIPIIAMTAYTMNDELELAINSGCNLAVTKPFKIESLLKIIQKYLPDL